tara:strand:+ start:1360 stop:1761 length:402 start_codon:yes stop_codon:yes gene_type:complete
MYLFDTDIISNIFKKKPSKKLIGRLKQIKKEEQYISTITIGEIVYGAIKSCRPDYHMNNLINVLLPSVNIVSYDGKSAFIYGQLRAKLENAGKIISHSDMQIAAVTMANDFILITGNIRHFKRIPSLKIENWI